MKDKIKSLRLRLFITLACTLIIIISLIILINNSVLESFYLYSKEKNLMLAYKIINNYYNGNKDENSELEIEKISINNDFDIVIKQDDEIIVYTTTKDFSMNIMYKDMVTKQEEKNNILYNKDNVVISKSADLKNGLTYILLSGKLDNGYTVYIRVAVTSIQESVKISNNFLCLIGGIVIIISAVIISFIAKKFTDPITKLSDIAVRMSKLDFSMKYEETDSDDEINRLGKSINLMSDKLETTINRLRQSNSELERDIEKKSKIDTMRKQFISDVSHELKTPIALIQGYAEGLVENVTTDDESRKYYAEVILDETSKMDKLVKSLLELMKLEYGEKEFNNKNFNIVELIKEIIKKYKFILEEQNINITFEKEQNIEIYADEFSIEQVINNYFTNAIKNTKEIDGKKEIKIDVKAMEDKQKARISVFNTGENIKEEDLQRIWNRFYKADESRNREDGGTGIGLAIVKAIMNNYNQEYGVINKENGVEFYFEIDLANM